MDIKPLVSVFCPTYNHENFIRQCLEGFILQKTLFPIEIFVQDDASTDKTTEIIKEYAAKYNFIIHVLHTENQYSQGKNLNEYFFKNAKGKYCAFCEGDDYWTDPYKLQKQVDFLEANPDYAICCHRVRLLNQEDPSYITYTPLQKSENTIEDLADSNFIITLSCVFRNKLFEALPPWFSDCKVGDYPLHLLNAQYGKIKYMPEIMGVYRIHPQGEWSKNKYTDQLLTVIEVCLYLSQFFSEEINNRLLKASGVLVELFYKHSTEQEKEKLKSIERYYSLLTYFMECNLQKEKQIAHLESEYEKQKLVLSSKEYRLGKILLKPLRYLKFFLFKDKYT